MNTTNQTADALAEFVAAVAYLDSVEPLARGVWTAMAEALEDWLGHASDRHCDGLDCLRVALTDLLEVVPEAGAPGGHRLAEVLDAALVDWAAKTAERINDGYPFTN